MALRQNLVKLFLFVMFLYLEISSCTGDAIPWSELGKTALNRWKGYVFSNSPVERKTEPETVTVYSFKGCMLWGGVDGKKRIDHKHCKKNEIHPLLYYGHVGISWSQEFTCGDDTTKIHPGHIFGFGPDPQKLSWTVEQYSVQGHPKISVASLLENGVPLFGKVSDDTEVFKVNGFTGCGIPDAERKHSGRIKRFQLKSFSVQMTAEETKDARQKFCNHYSSTGFSGDNLMYTFPPTAISTFRRISPPPSWIANKLPSIPDLRAGFNGVNGVRTLFNCVTWPLSFLTPSHLLTKKLGRGSPSSVGSEAVTDTAFDFDAQQLPLFCPHSQFQTL